MTQDQQRAAIVSMMQEHAARVTVDPRTALQSLIDDGVYTLDGELAPEFGGEAKKAAQAR